MAKPQGGDDMRIGRWLGIPLYAHPKSAVANDRLTHPTARGHATRITGLGTTAIYGGTVGHMTEQILVGDGAPTNESDSVPSLTIAVAFA